jgi:hypothetical protein
MKPDSNSHIERSIRLIYMVVKSTSQPINIPRGIKRRLLNKLAVERIVARLSEPTLLLIAAFTLGFDAP